MAVASGHGIGKSALVAWIILWAMSTCRTRAASSPPTPRASCAPRPGPSSPSGWRCATNRHWFTYTATSLHSSQPGHDKTWRVDAITWSENNTEAIAGLHNKGKRAFALFDEASAIPEGVWETVEGALTDGGTELFWAAFGNPTRTTGRFRECFAGGRFAHRWPPQQIDSRSVSMTNKAQIASWVKDYGEDSRFRARARARRLPRAGIPAVHRQRAHRRGRRARARARSDGAAGHGRRHRPPGRRPQRHPLPPRPRRARDPGGEVPHPRSHAGGEPRHGAGQCAQSRRGVRRRHRHRLGRRRSPGPARLPQSAWASISAAAPIAPTAAMPPCATPTSGPRCGAS